MNYSPSKLGKKKLCPKFDYKETDPDDPKSAAAIGTLLHEAFATGNMSGLSEEERVFIEAARMQSDGFAGTLPQPVLTLSEVKVECANLPLRGTADKVYVGGDRALVADLKTGPNGLPDDADDSEQVLAYILGVYNAFPNVVSCDGILINPRTREISDRMQTERKDIPSLEARLGSLIAVIEDPFSEPCPGSHCTDCRHVARCWALAPTIKQAGSLLWPLTPSDLDPTNVTVDPAVRGVRAVLRSILEKWCDAVKEADNASGVTPPGWKRIERAGNPTVPVENRLLVVERIRDLGIPDNVLWACARLTLGDVVEQLRVVNNISKEEAKTKLYDAIQGLTDSKPVSYITRDKKGLSDAEIAKLFHQTKEAKAIQ